jgi:hypothetical protein
MAAPPDSDIASEIALPSPEGRADIWFNTHVATLHKSSESKSDMLI